MTLVLLKNKNRKLAVAVIHNFLGFILYQIDYFVRFNFPLEITVSGMFCGKFHTLSQLCGHSQLYLSADLGDKKNLMFFVIKGLVYKDTKTHYIHYITNISAFTGLSNVFPHCT